MKDTMLLIVIFFICAIGYGLSFLIPIPETLEKAFVGGAFLSAYYALVIPVMCSLTAKKGERSK